MRPGTTASTFVDRQYIIGRERFDLMGFFWSNRQRRPGQTVDPCLVEIKFALSTDIAQVHRQLARYYELTVADTAGGNKKPGFSEKTGFLASNKTIRPWSKPRAALACARA